jgi:hypothetical protein
VILLLSSAVAGRAQLTDEDIARLPFWEKFLSGAKILGAENIGDGLIHPKKLRLQRNGVEAWAAAVDITKLK